jgi:hypothetical protein
VKGGCVPGVGVLASFRLDQTDGTGIFNASLPARRGPWAERL